jgi:cellulose synthase (UDP-forming)
MAHAEMAVAHERPHDDQTTPARSAENQAARSPSLTLLVLAATAGVVLYAKFLLDPANRGDWLPYLMVMAAETVLVVHCVLAMWTILSGGANPRRFAFHHAQDRLYDWANILRDRAQDQPWRWEMFLRDRPVTVDVFVTTCGEDVEVIRRTVTAARAMSGAHTVWVLDDGRSDEVRDLAAELGTRYVRRLTNGGAKAGNINHALSLAHGELFAIFDADFVPSPDFLHETVPFFAEDDVAFVQTPQVYGNLDTIVSRGAGYMQSVFYRFVQPGRNRFNAAFCVGTNVVFRRAAIDQIGGLYALSKSEDVWTSLMLHERGWRSVYIPTALAVGDTPETIEAYSKQQLRWATGGFEILLTHWPWARRRPLTVDQRLQYTVTATHYLTGIAPLLLLLVPPLQIYFGLTPMNLSVTPLQWFAYYVGFYFLQIVLAFYTLGSFRWEVLLLSSVSFPIYVRAFVNALLRRDQAWHVTGSKGGYRSPFAFIQPQVLMFVLLAATTVVGLWKDMSNGSLSLALAWNATNTLILGGFVVTALREGRRGRRAARQPAPVTAERVAVTAERAPVAIGGAR